MENVRLLEVELILHVLIYKWLVWKHMVGGLETLRGRNLTARTVIATPYYSVYITRARFEKQSSPILGGRLPMPSMLPRPRPYLDPP